MSIIKRVNILMFFTSAIILLYGSIPYAQGDAAEKMSEKVKPALEETEQKKESDSGAIIGSIEVDGTKRTYVVYLPPGYDGKKPLPVIFVLHGGQGFAGKIEPVTKTTPKASQEGFMAVYPNGTGVSDSLRSWNAGSCCSYAKENNIDDVKFFRALIEKLGETYTIDPKRIYSTGLSNGSMMSYRLACELSDKIAAIAPVAGSMQIECAPEQPVSIIAFHGIGDQHTPYYGGQGLQNASKRLDKPVSYAIDFWVKHNGCSPLPQKEEFGSIIKETYGNCNAGAEVVLYTVKGEGGHAWPGGLRSSETADEPTQEISATDLMFEFFSRHSK